MTLKNTIINGIIEREGGYVDDPNDSGGATCWGITEDVARRHGYTGVMKDLPRDLAFTIYSMSYWDKLKLDEIFNLSELVAEEMADTSVNMGTERAGEFLQRGLNALNCAAKYWPDLKVDGMVGSKTLHSLSEFLDIRGSQGEIVLHRTLNGLQLSFYVELVEKREKDETFFYGWVLNRVR